MYLGIWLWKCRWSGRRKKWGCWRGETCLKAKLKFPWHRDQQPHHALACHANDATCRHRVDDIIDLHETHVDAASCGFYSSPAHQWYFNEPKSKTYKWLDVSDMSSALVSPSNKIFTLHDSPLQSLPANEHRPRIWRAIVRERCRMWMVSSNMLCDCS